ncbi:MAG: hypothetical protein RIS36_637 [Pseudomonadota bacterium]|jgi:hypothetical protein
MVHMVTSTKYFELFERRNPGTVRVSTENSKEAYRGMEWAPTSTEVT